MSPVEITNISQHGFWLLLDDRELFLPFAQFPWFKGASVEAILMVERPRAEHLYWPELDVDLEVESIEHPDKRLSKNNSYSFLISVIVRGHAKQTHGSDDTNEVSQSAAGAR